MQDKWILEWQITRYGAKEEYDSFEEAKAAFQKKLATEIDLPEYFEVMDEQFDTLLDGEEVKTFLEKFFKEGLTEDDLIETDIFCEFEGHIDHNSIYLDEAEFCGQQIYPRIESNFTVMNDPDKMHRFLFIDPYCVDGIQDFGGYSYLLMLRKKRKDEYAY